MLLLQWLPKTDYRMIECSSTRCSNPVTSGTPWTELVPQCFARQPVSFDCSKSHNFVRQSMACFLYIVRTTLTDSVGGSWVYDVHQNRRYPGYGARATCAPFPVNSDRFGFFVRFESNGVCIVMTFFSLSGHYWVW